MTASKGAVLLFGAFNPFTNAHLHIGRLAAEKFPGYEVIYIPARLAYFQVWKGSDEADVLPEKLRAEIIKAGIAGEEGFSVCEAEISGLVNGRTWNTLRFLRQEYGYTDLVLCMGTDKVAELETWYMGRELVAGNRFLIITRSGERLADSMTDYTSQHRENFTELCNDRFSDLSATAVREAAAAGDEEFIRASMPAASAEMYIAAVRK